MNISADQTVHELMAANPNDAKPQWINMKEYWNKRKQVQKKLQSTHPLYRYPKSPYSNLTKVVLNAHSTTRLEQLSKPKKNFALDDSILSSKSDNNAKKFQNSSMNESLFKMNLNSKKK